MPKWLIIPLALIGAVAFAQEPQFGGRRPAGAAKPAARDFFGIGPAPDPAAVARGQKVYAAQCGFCHGASGKGGSGGPDLIRSVLVMHDDGGGKEVGPVIRQGRPAKGMPKFEMADAQINDIAAFLKSLIRATIERGGYKILSLATGNAKTGQAYFGTHCANCHSATGDLAKIGAKYDEPTLLTRFLYSRNPSAKSKPTATITLPSGQSVSGEVSWVDDFTIGLVDAAGQVQSYSLNGKTKLAIRDPLEAHEKLLRQYTDADMHNILTYLVTLK